MKIIAESPPTGKYTEKGEPLYDHSIIKTAVLLGAEVEFMAEDKWYRAMGYVKAHVEKYTVSKMRAVIYDQGTNESNC